MRVTRNGLLGLAGAFAILAAAPVLAADRKNPGTQAGDSQTGAAMQPAGSVSASDLIGREVRNAAGEQVGDIESVIIGEDGNARAVIVSVGGFLGMGEHSVAIDWEQMQPAAEQDAVVVNMTEEQLRALPEYAYSGERQPGEMYEQPDFDLVGDRSSPPGAAGVNAPRNRTGAAGLDRSDVERPATETDPRATEQQSERN